MMHGILIYLVGTYGYTHSQNLDYEDQTTRFPEMT